MDILKYISSADTFDVTSPDIQQPNKRVVIIDAMADVQSIDKPSWIMTCKDLSADFIALYKENINLMSYMLCLTGHSIIVSMIRKYHHHEPQTTPWHRKEEPLNHGETPGRQIKQSNQLSLPYKDDCNTRMDIK